jgi:hypothetical protein
MLKKGNNDKLKFQSKQTLASTHTPMAIVILCGLFSSTLLNMIVVHHYFVNLEKLQVNLCGIGRKPTAAKKG